MSASWSLCGSSSVSPRVRLRLLVVILAAGTLGLARFLRSPWLREFRLGRMREPELQAWTERRPDDPLGHYYLALARGRAGDTPEAARQLARALELDPALARARWRLARVLAVSGQESAAERLLQQGLQLDPAAASLHAELGRVYLAHEQFRPAATEWEKATSLTPRDGDAWYHLGRCWMGLNDQARALTAYCRAAALAPRSPTYQKALAGVLRLEREYGEAERCCRRALALAPSDPDAHFELARLLWDRDGATPQAEESMRRAVALQPDSPLLRYSLAAMEQDRGDLATALREYQATLRLLTAREPPAAASAQRDRWLSQLEGPHFNLAKLLQRLGRPAEAARHLAAFRRISDSRNQARRRLVRSANRPGDPALSLALPRPPAAVAAPPFVAARATPDLARAPGVPQFRDVAALAGIQFRQGVGGKRPLTILEATGSGCAFIDYDNDGWPDLFFAGHPRCALYHNNRDGTFTDVTRASGLGREGFWIGCGTGDYDNDGRIDLFVTGYHTCALYHNNGHGGFTDVTAKAGIQDRAYQTSCTFADIDRDGFLDLYICHYVRFGPHEPQYCPAGDGRLQRACGPDAYLPEIGVFYHNRGDGTFAEATKQFGLDSAHGKAWGAAFADYDRDGWPDLYVANDEMPGDLFHNEGGRMKNVGAESGTAYSRDGFLQGGMGADFGDYDNDGRPDLVVTNFWMEPNSLYHNDGHGLFSEFSYAAGLAPGTLKKVGFGTRFLDADNDGWLDLFFLNGHVQDTHWIHPEEGMRELMQLFLNQQNGRFREVSAAAGEPFQRPVVGRGAAFGDFNNDGRPDLAAIDMEGPALLLRNNGPADRSRRGHWLIVRALTGPGPRDAIGAQITIDVGGKKQLREVQTSGSVLSANDPRVHFGLGAATRVDHLSIRWPDGSTETRTGIQADQILTLRQRRTGKG